MASNDHDYPELSYWPSHISGPTFSWTSEWTDSAPVNFGDFRHSALSFDVEEFDEAATGFSDVLSNASEPSPRLETYSHGPNLNSGYVGEDAYLYNSPSPGLQSGDLQADTGLMSLGSPSHAFGGMSIGGPLISTPGISQMSLELGGNGTITTSPND